MNLETISLGDKRFFEISIGKRAVITDLHNNNDHEIFGNLSLNKDEKHPIPLYSANVEKIFGYVEKSNLYSDVSDKEKFDKNHILWGIDGNFELKVIQKKTHFASTDHCGTIKILDDNIMPEYVKLLLEEKKHQLGFDRTLRSNLENMSNMVYLDIQLDGHSNFDYEKQKNVIEQHMSILNFLEKISDIQKEVNNQRINLETEYDNVEKPLNELFTIKQGNSYYTKKRILTNGWIGNIPVYSSNTKNNGLLINMREDEILENDLYYQHCLTWSVDGYAGKLFERNDENMENKKKKKYFFTINNHCGILIPLHGDLYLPFFKYLLQPLFFDMSKGYGNKKLGTNQIENIQVKVPIDKNGKYDYKKQKEVATMYEIIEKTKQKFTEYTDAIKNSKVVIIDT